MQETEEATSFEKNPKPLHKNQSRPERQKGETWDICV